MTVLRAIRPAEAARFRLLIGPARRLICLADALRLHVRQLRGGQPMQVPAIGAAVRLPTSGQAAPAWIVDAGPDASAAVLLFHGIGDRTTYWRRAQAMLATHGISSLVFQYLAEDGYEAEFDPAALEDAGRAAYVWYRSRLPPKIPLFCLGFSLGTGLIAAILSSLEPAPTGLILCQAYPTLRQAAARIVRPMPVMARLLPDIWRTRDTLACPGAPLLIVHGEGDVLFPAAMARTLARSVAVHRSVRLASIPRHRTMLFTCRYPTTTGPRSCVF